MRFTSIPPCKTEYYRYTSLLLIHFPFLNMTYCFLYEMRETSKFPKAHQYWLTLNLFAVEFASQAYCTNVKKLNISYQYVELLYLI